MKKFIACIILWSTATLANASVITTSTSPTSSGDLSSTGISLVGGIVFDFVGLNGNSIVAQLAASDLFRGRVPTNPLTLGTQTGFTIGLLGALGGGLSEVAIRLTLFDGDSSVGDFDFNDNQLLVNGFSIGNFSDVLTWNTSSDGVTSSGQVLGYSDAELGTGWFYSDNSSFLSSFFNSLVSTNQVVVSLDDVDPGDNYLDFRQGLDSGLASTSVGAQVANPVNESNSLLIMLMGLFLIFKSRRVIQK